MSRARRAIQHVLGYAIGFFAALIAEIGLLIGIESLLERSIGLSGLSLLLVPTLVGIPVARWFGPLDWVSLLSGQRDDQPKPPKPKSPWNFKLIGTLALFWFLSLLAVIVLFGPFGLENNTSTVVRILKIAVTTVVIAGIGGFLLRKELTKLMSPSKK